MKPGEGTVYVKQTSDDCWREMFEMFDDGLSPEDAASEEAYRRSDNSRET